MGYLFGTIPASATMLAGTGTAYQVTPLARLRSPAANVGPARRRPAHGGQLLAASLDVALREPAAVAVAMSTYDAARDAAAGPILDLTVAMTECSPVRHGRSAVRPFATPRAPRRLVGR